MENKTHHLEIKDKLGVLRKDLMRILNQMVRNRGKSSLMKKMMITTAEIREDQATKPIKQEDPGNNQVQIESK